MDTAPRIEKEMLALRIPRPLKKQLLDAAWDERITLTEFVSRVLEAAFPAKKKKAN